MRLTLRTLLAYLDDTLDPAEIKQIGLKAAESDAAQELIARIKQVTRRRRLTTPPVAGNGTKVDPNTIAEYLDNVLPGDDVADIEKTCLESDVHLAEIAACHQILTLVLGEPALVPPTARQRMYTLVRGKESIPNKKAARVQPVGRNLEQPPMPNDRNDDGLMGLPLGKQSGLVRWLIPICAAVLLLVLGYVLLQSLNNPNQQQAKTKPTPTFSATTPTPPSTKSDVKPPDNPKPPDNTTKPPDNPKPPDNTTKPPDNPKPPDNTTKPPDNPKPPDQPKEIGKIVAIKDVPHLLVHQVGDKKEWKQLKPDAEVQTGQSLVALPGTRSIIRTSTGVDLTLWANVPEFLNMPVLESAVTLRPRSEPDVDLQFMLSRGRVLLTNKKPNGSVKVRVQFNEDGPKPAETWDIVLESPESEVSIDLIGRYPEDVPFQLKGGPGPKAEVYFVVLKGQVSAKVGREMMPNLEPAPSARSFLSWDNVGGVARVSGMNPQMLIFWDKEYPKSKPVDQSAQNMQMEVEALTKRAAAESIDLVLDGMAQATKPTDRKETRMYAVFCLGAIDDLSKVVDTLSDEEAPPEVGQVGIMTLRNWIGRKADHDVKLYELLINAKRFTSADAESVLQLLHDLTPQQRQDQKTYAALISFLNNDKAAIRLLSYYHLYRLVPDARGPMYNPIGDSTKRQTAYEAWRKMLAEGKLPPIPSIPGVPAPTPPR